MWESILATILPWIKDIIKKIKITYRIENTAFEGKIIAESLIFQIVNLSQKPIFIKYCYILDRKNQRIIVFPESFWTARGEISSEEMNQLDQDRMLDIIYDKNEILKKKGEKFVLEEETGKKFSIRFNIEKCKSETYTVSRKK